MKDLLIRMITGTKEDLLADFDRVRNGEKKMIMLYIQDNQTGKVEDELFSRNDIGKPMFDRTEHQLKTEFNDSLQNEQSQILSWRLGDSLREIEDDRKD